MKYPEDLPRELSEGAFDVASARLRGVSDERLRRRDLRRPFHGVRAPRISRVDRSNAGSPPIAAKETNSHKWAAILATARMLPGEYAARMPEDQFFSHVTAAIIHGLPLPFGLLTQRLVDVGSSVRTRRRKGRNVAGHFVPADSVTVVDVGGLRLASVVDTWCQLATTLSLDELIIMGDALVCRQHPPATMAELEAAVVRQTGRPGARLLREAFTYVRPRTDSPRETILRLIIVRAGLPEPEVNGEILGRFGEFLAWGDLMYRRHKILMEYDGEGHREDEKQFHRDVDRLDALMEEGWRVIRYNKSHLRGRRNEITGRIRRALLERGWIPPK